MTPYSSSRGLLYSAPPSPEPADEDTDADAADASTSDADTAAPTAADD